MKNKFKIIIKFGRASLGIKSLNALFRSTGKGLVKYGLAMLKLIGINLTKGRIKSVVFLLFKLKHIYDNSGPKGLTKFLKTCSVALQQYLGSYKVKDSSLIGGGCRVKRSRSGIPLIIPALFRHSIRQNDYESIKWVLTILNFYRNISFKGKPDLSTISNKPVATLELSITKLAPFVVIFCNLFFIKRGFGSHRLINLLKGESKLFPIFKSAPGLIKEAYQGMGLWNYSTHPLQLIVSCRALMKQRLSKGSATTFWQALYVLAQFMGNEALITLMSAATQFAEGPYRTSIGKLSVKEEPAGKVRIFAMVDAWTQWVLYPLHRVLFTVLKDVPSDGTFDQHAPLWRLISMKPSSMYSLDLSSATDLLPVRLQEEILRYLFGPTFAYYWKILLVGRRYSFTKMGYEQYHGRYVYGTGQPMGALSSWAMLAITHHFIVQVAYWRSGGDLSKLYDRYALLGDDLVILDKPVADEYLRLIKELGMKVNVSKSILSDNGRCLEFAKRTIYLGVDVSPFTLKELFHAEKSLIGATAFINKHLGGIPGLSQFCRVLGFSWKCLSKIGKGAYNSFNGQIRSLYLGVHIPVSIHDVPFFMEIGHWGRKIDPELVLGLLVSYGANLLDKVEAQQIELDYLEEDSLMENRAIAGLRALSLFDRQVAVNAVIDSKSFGSKLSAPVGVKKALIRDLASLNERQLEALDNSANALIPINEDLINPMVVLIRDPLTYDMNKHRETLERLTALVPTVVDPEITHNQNLYDPWVYLFWFIQEAFKEVATVDLSPWDFIRVEQGEDIENVKPGESQLMVRFYREFSKFFVGLRSGNPISPILSKEMLESFDSQSLSLYDLVTNHPNKTTHLFNCILILDKLSLVLDRNIEGGLPTEGRDQFARMQELVLNVHDKYVNWSQGLYSPGVSSED